MAASEFNNRLDYLISYSSQLVFVCSDKIKQQSQVIEHFLADKSEHTDVALLTANELTPLVIYREKLYRQLVSQDQKADFNRPLNQLLAPLNGHTGPILINIFQADRLPNKLVKELWELVLQSRFANNKQQLNVLLIGESSWAEQAKLGLGSKSKDKPILLNSHADFLVPPTDLTDESSDLESLIQDSRQKFAQRIKDRNYQSYASAPFYKKWWVSALLGLVFLTVFVGLLSWQYPEKIKLGLAYVFTPLTVSEPLKPEDLVVQKPIQSDTPATVEQIFDEIEKLESAVHLPVVDNANLKSMLVTDWQSASAKLSSKASELLLQASEVEVPEVFADNKVIEASLTGSIEPEKELNVVSEVTPKLVTAVNDYQVEDIVVPNEIAEPQVFAIEPTTLEQSVIELSKFEKDVTYSFLDLIPEASLAADERFVIQVAAMSNMTILQDYVREQNLSGELWMYKTKRYGGDWYVLLKSQYFSSINAARNEIANLPESMTRNTPFVKSTKQIKREIGELLL